MHAEMHALSCQDQSYLASINNLGDQSETHTHTHKSFDFVEKNRLLPSTKQEADLKSELQTRREITVDKWFQSTLLPPFFLTPEESDVAKL